MMASFFFFLKLTANCSRFFRGSVISAIEGQGKGFVSVDRTVLTFHEILRGFLVATTLQATLKSLDLEEKRVLLT